MQFCCSTEASAAVKRLQAFLLNPEAEETKRSPVTEADMVSGMLLLCSCQEQHTWAALMMTELLRLVVRCCIVLPDALCMHCR